MHCSSRKLLPSGGHSCRATDRRLWEELSLTKAFLSGLSRKRLQPGWPGQSRGPHGGLSFSPSVTCPLEGARTSKGQLPSVKHVHAPALLVRRAGSFRVPASMASSPDALGRGRRPGQGLHGRLLALRPWAEAHRVSVAMAMVLEHGSLPEGGLEFIEEEPRDWERGQLVTPALRGSPSGAHGQPGGNRPETPTQALTPCSCA